MYGPITTDWKLDGGTFALDTTIPANTTATVILPATSADQITEGGKPLADIKGLKVLDAKDGSVSLSVGSGTYNFVQQEVARSRRTSASAPAREHCASSVCAARSRARPNVPTRSRSRLRLIRRRFTIAERLSL